MSAIIFWGEELAEARRAGDRGGYPVHIGAPNQRTEVWGSLDDALWASVRSGGTFVSCPLTEPEQWFALRAIRALPLEADGAPSVEAIAKAIGAARGKSHDDVVAAAHRTDMGAA